LGLAILLTTVAVAELPEDGKARRPKNVLLLLTDDQSAHLACLGTPGIATPNIDRLAARGILFRNAFATCASCSPSRSSILTGMYPHSNGHWRNTVTPTMTDPDKEYGRKTSIRDHVGVHEDLPTIIEILNQQGYVTGIAHTSAVYVTVAGRPVFAPVAARHWAEQMRRHSADVAANGNFANDGQRREAVGYIDAGVRMFEELIERHGKGE